MKPVKYYFTNNLKWKAFALFAAISLWVFSINQADPVIEQIFLRQLELRNIEHLSQNNIVILNEQLLRSTQVLVNVSSRESVPISQDEVIPFIDLSTIPIPDSLDDPLPITLNIEAEIDSPIVQGGYVISINTRQANFNIDRIVTVNLPVNAVVTNSPPLGFSANNITVNPQNIIVIGPQNLINNIYQVQAHINLDGITYHTSVSAPLIILDEEDNDITSNFNLEQNTVNLDISINSLTTVPLIGPTIIGANSLPEGHIFNGYTLSAQNVQIFGDSAAVASISSIPLGEIDITGFAATQTINIDIRNLISNVEVYSNPHVEVTINIASLEPYIEDPIFNINLPVTQIEITGYTQNIIVADYIILTVRGRDINVSAITGTINIENLETGVHNVEVNVNIPNGTLVEPAFAIVTVYEGYPAQLPQYNNENEEEKENENND